MRILFWTDGFWPRLGGIERQSLKFIQGMQQKGHEFWVVAQKDHSSWKEEERYQGIQIRRFDFNTMIGKKDLKTLGMLQKFLETTFKEFPFDLVHLNANVGGSIFAFLLSLKWFQIPIVATVYGPYLYQGALLPVIQQVLSRVDRACCISNWVFETMVQRLPHLKSKFRLIYCGLPFPEAAPRPLPFSPPRLFSFGRLSKEKGFDIAIEAFSLLKKKGSPAELFIGGGGPERISLERLAQERGLGSSIQFLGVLSEEEVIGAYNQSTVVMAPSLIESFGLVILEAMQMQRPVIASRIEGIPEVVSEGETGLLVPMKDPAALCRALEDLLAEPEKAIAMGIKGRQKAKQFTLAAYIDQYEALYGEL